MTHAIIDPGTVVVHHEYTGVAHRAVMCSSWLDVVTSFTAFAYKSNVIGRLLPIS